jgi:hypothetical protein
MDIISFDTLSAVVKKREPLTDYEVDKILEALFHAERNAHPSNKRAWNQLTKSVEAKFKV